MDAHMAYPARSPPAPLPALGCPGRFPLIAHARPRAGWTWVCAPGPFSGDAPGGPRSAGIWLRGGAAGLRRAPPAGAVTGKSASHPRAKNGQWPPASLPRIGPGAESAMAATVQILTGPPGSGKTRRLIERSQELNEGAVGATLWLVPTYRHVED